jgi:predicted lipid-binding transport protein (Tim44 family)
MVARIALAALIMLATACPMAWAQAFRPIPFRPMPMPRPMPSIPGGGLHPHVPLHLQGANNDDSDVGMYLFIGLIVLGAISLCWQLGSQEDRWSNNKPVSATTATESSGANHAFTGTAPPDRILAPGDVAEKSAGTTRLLEHLARTEPLFDPWRLREMIRETFDQVQQCWQARDASPVRDRMTKEALAAYEKGISDMRRGRMINRLESLGLLRQEFVHVVHAENSARQMATALVTFQTKAPFVHEKTGVHLSGRSELETYQEFWTFQRCDDRWLLHAVKPSGDETKLREPNVAAGFTDVELRNLERGVIVL